MTTEKTVAVINKSKIVVIENGEKMVPVKPICQALGVDFSTQKGKIEKDEILGLVVGLRPTTGSDGKQYEMFCIPFKFVFGWLFTINPKNVSEAAREGLIKYKEACYNALYQSFTDSQEFLEAKQEMVEEKLGELEVISDNFKDAKNKLSEKKKELNMVRNLTLEDWIKNNRQLGLFTEA